MSRCFRSHIRFSIISALIILPFSFTANSILLSTITDRGIQGAEPRLHSDLETEIANQAFNRFGFTYNDVNYDDNNISSFPLIAASTKVSAFKSQLTSTFKDTLIGDDATDANGDGNFKLVGIDDSDEVLAPQALSIKIRDGNNVDIADLATTKDKTFCELSLSNPGPYKIEISNNLRLTTEYGDPRKKDYTVATTETSLKQPSKQYSIDVAGLCNLKPASMQVYTGTAGNNIEYASGYNPDKWDAGKGFRPDSGFPTTGFYKAKFNLIGSGNDQSKFQCTTTSSDVTLSGTATTALGANCSVTLNQKPTADIVIKMEYNRDGTWTPIDGYTIPFGQITKWALPQSSTFKYGSGSNFSALDHCRTVLGDTTVSTAKTTWQQARGQTPEDRVWRQQYMYRRDELTNSPKAYKDEGTSPSLGSSYFSRDIGTFTSEWGSLASYSGSSWVSSYTYWVAEAWSGSHQYYVQVTDGYVGYNYPDNSDNSTIRRTLCRGD